MRGQRHALAALYPQERPGTHYTGGWVGPRAGLDRCGNSRFPTGIRFPDRPARSQSLYRLSYPAHKVESKGTEYVTGLLLYEGRGFLSMGYVVSISCNSLEAD